jgi:phosphonate transport system permease protein
VLRWAIIFVILVGLGPLAGTFGIAAYTVGYLAKIYADLFEGTDPEILEAVKSTGASRLQLVRFVIVPEAANAILAQVLFMLEYNIRASSILGFVGAGGLGFIIQIYLQSLDYRRLATVLLLVLVVVLAMDGLSAWLRKRFLLSTQAS